MRPLAPLPRAVLLAGAGALLVASAPGELAADGVPPLALPGLALWAWATARPGSAAGRLDVALSALAWGALLRGTAGVSPLVPLALGLVLGAWQALAGLCLRASARRLPLALALPAVWVGVEVLRRLAPQPVGLAWLPLGARFATIEELARAAPFVGPEGIGFVAAAAAGACADVAESLHAVRLRSRRVLVPAALVLAPLGAVLALGRAAERPALREGPYVVGVRTDVRTPRPARREACVDAFARATRATRAALDFHHPNSLDLIPPPDPDLVVWGAGVWCPSKVFTPGTADALAAGAAAAPWQDPVDAAAVAGWRRETDLALAALFDRPRGGILPERTAFVAGAELWEPVGGRLVRREALVAWDARGAYAGHVAKSRPAPGRETGLGLERHPWGRDALRALFGAVGDVGPAAPGATLAVEGRGGARWRVAAGLGLDATRPGTFAPEGGADLVLIALDGAEVGERAVRQLALAARAWARAADRPLVVAANAGPSGAWPGPTDDDPRAPDLPAEEHGLHARLFVPLDGARPTFWARHRRLLDGLWVAAAVLATGAGSLLARRSRGSDAKLR